MGWRDRLFGSKKSDEDVEDDLSWLTPPSDMHNPTAWTKYWRDQFEHEPEWAFMSDMFVRDDALVKAIRALGLRTVLCAGNGVSREPLALAYAGCRVTVLDVCEIPLRVVEHIAKNPVSADDPEPFKMYFESPMARDGGAVEYVVGDLSDPQVCPGPFDVILERRTVQLFPVDERGDIISALLNRLSTPGILFSHMHDNRWRPPNPHPSHFAEQWLAASGLVRLPGDLETSLQSDSALKRYSYLLVTTG